jgi:hypothetical protein
MPKNELDIVLRKFENVIAPDNQIATRRAELALLILLAKDQQRTANGKTRSLIFWPSFVASHFDQVTADLRCSTLIDWQSPEPD